MYEHCCRALDRGLTTGQHGLPLIGCGDWNDGFSRVGRLGRGESVWLGFFIDYVLERMLPLCCERGDDERVARYAAYRERLRAALNSAGWDGAWYRRAYYDNGQPIGSATSDECQIDALAQAWAVLSGVAPPERARMAMDAVEARLVDDEAGMIRLLTPAFDRTPNDPGYIKGYLPGIRENGGQYTHGVLWVVRAMAEMGRGTRAVELLRMLTPGVAHEHGRASGHLSDRAVRRGGGCLWRTAARRPRRLDVVHRLGRLDVSRGRGIDLRLVDRTRAHARHQSVDFVGLAANAG